MIQMMCLILNIPLGWTGTMGALERAPHAAHAKSNAQQLSLRARPAFMVRSLSLILKELVKRNRQGFDAPSRHRSVHGQHLRMRASERKAVARHTESFKHVGGRRRTVSGVIAIRTARSRDAQAIVSLMGQLGYPVSVEDVVERLQGRRRSRQVFVATRDGRVLGWAAVSLEESFVTGRGALIEGFVVDESARNEGIGAELLRSVERWARERGSATIRVLSNVIRERAHRFYERHGYGRIKAQYNFDKRLERS
jgi:GNAT superfamily N-acetyltransferase